MGNSQLDIIVFGRRAGIYAAEHVLAGVTIGRLTLEHVDRYSEKLEELGIDKKRISPVILPDYIPDHVKAKQLTLNYFGTLT